MKHFNGHNLKSGFTFIEVMMALTLVAMVITPLFTVQYNVLGLVSRASQSLSKLFLIESLFAQSLLETRAIKSAADFSFEKKDIVPNTTISYVVASLPEKSVLKKIDDLYLVRAQGKWSSVGIPYDETIISFMYRPEPAEQEQKI